MRPTLSIGLLVLASLGACAPERSTVPVAPPPPPISSAPSVPLPPESPPTARLPADVRPLRYKVELRVDPKLPRFEGQVDVVVQLDRQRDVIWLHGRDLAVHRVTVQPEAGPALEAQWEQVTPSGVAAVRLPSPVGPGKVTLRIAYDAPWGRSDQALSVVKRGADAYAFSQFEATDARRTFPCFDEPAFKTPYEIALSVPKGLVAISNARETSRTPEPGGAWERVAFAPTAPLPSYLVAFAVGPFDVVEASLPPTAIRKRTLPVRLIATRGRGRELGYAARHTGALVTALEAYFDAEYPYDKLDLIAVPEKSGAMENAGALMFEEGVLLVEDRAASLDARFYFAAFVGHEIAHQWFGDLVTMPWWDDLWLNEAFATWMEPRLVAALNPELHPEVRALESVHAAMDADSLVSARKIRQEIANDDDIDSAFDDITYDKGGGVLSMFERWIGPEAFKKGVRAYLAAHRFGTAGAGDLLDALSAAAGRDVAAPMKTFLDQPGLPFVDAKVECDGKPRVRLAQSRFLPLGSKGDATPRTWQIPVCVRYADGKDVREACTLLADREGVLPLDAASCPAWVMPNADGAGYYRYALAPADRGKLAASLGALRETERISVARNLAASFVRGTMPVGEVLDALAPFASDTSQPATAPLMDLTSTLAGWLEGDPLEAKVRAYADALFLPAYRSLGWAPKKGQSDPPGRVALRQGVLDFLALTARDPAVRREAAARGKAALGLAKDARSRALLQDLAPDLFVVGLQVAAEDGGAPVFDALLAALDAEPDEMERRRLLTAIGSATEPALAARARELELSPRVHPNEVGTILFAQARRQARRATREGAWGFLSANVDRILARMQPAYASRILRLGVGFCDAAHRDATEKLFMPRLGQIEGGQRALANALEEASLCIARRAVHEPGARAYFAKKKR